MTLYELIGKISRILTPETDEFYHYVLHTSDDNGGFLRTRYCWWDKPLQDYKIPDMEKALVCFRYPFVESDLTKDRKETRVKLQLFYYFSSEGWKGDVIWSMQLGYGIPYLFDLKEMTYRVVPDGELGELPPIW